VEDLQEAGEGVLCCYVGAGGSGRLGLVWVGKMVRKECDGLDAFIVGLEILGMASIHGLDRNTMVGLGWQS
jgi:hypothetical protein